MCFTIDRPSPVPPVPRPPSPEGKRRARSARQNRSKIRGRSCARIPIPVSATTIRAVAADRHGLRVHLPAAGVYLMALSSRLNSTWSISIRFARTGTRPGGGAGGPGRPAVDP
jgi:hypothetical protein